MGPNDPAVQEDERRIVVGVDGSACASRAVEFAVRQAPRLGAPLLVVSAYHEVPAVAGLVVPGGLIDESAEAIVSDAIRLAEDLEPTVTVKGETVLDAPGPALAQVSKGATAFVVDTRGNNEVAGVFLGSVSQYVSLSDPPQGLFLRPLAQRHRQVAATFTPKDLTTGKHTTQSRIAVRRIVIRNMNAREAQ